MTLLRSSLDSNLEGRDVGVLLEEDVSWIVRRLPRTVADVLKANAGRLFLAGGFIRSCIANETVSDVDLFAPSVEDAKAIANAFAASRGTKVTATDNACTVKVGELPVQFIHRWTFSDPLSCVASFDFTIASAAVWYTSDGDRWQSCCDDRFYADLAARRLVYRSPIRNEDAGGSLLRLLKFYQRGYRVTLPSLGAVVARLAMGFDLGRLHATGVTGIELERQLAKVATGLLIEVDPNAIITNQSTVGIQGDAAT